MIRDELGPMLKCLVRHKDLKATEEERVRQRVLHWLIHECKTAQRHLEVEFPMSFADRSRGRADIVIWTGEEHDKAEVLIECKAEGFLLGEDVRGQAIGYAQRLRCPAIWLTNGDSHRFFKKDGQQRWVECSGLEVRGQPLLASKARPPRPPLRHLGPPELGRYLKAYELVRNAFFEAGRDDLIKDERIQLGTLPRVDRVIWKSSRAFLGNLFHYALVRSQLREAHRYKHAE